MSLTYRSSKSRETVFLKPDMASTQVEVEKYAGQGNNSGYAGFHWSCPIPLPQKKILSPGPDGQSLAWLDRVMQTPFHVN